MDVKSAVSSNQDNTWRHDEATIIADETSSIISTLISGDEQTPRIVLPSGNPNKQEAVREDTEVYLVIFLTLKVNKRLP
jgi:hypothetical protein